MDSLLDKMVKSFGRKKKSWFFYGNDITRINEIIYELKRKLNTNVYIKSHDKYWKCYSGEKIILFDIHYYTLKTLYDSIMDWTTDFEFNSVQYDETHKMIVSPKNQIFIIRSSLPIEKLFNQNNLSALDKFMYESFRDQFEILNVK